MFLRGRDASSSTKSLVQVRARPHVARMAGTYRKLVTTEKNDTWETYCKWKHDKAWRTFLCTFFFWKLIWNMSTWLVVLIAAWFCTCLRACVLLSPTFLALDNPVVFHLSSPSCFRISYIIFTYVNHRFLKHLQGPEINQGPRLTDHEVEGNTVTWRSVFFKAKHEPLKITERVGKLMVNWLILLKIC